MGAIVKLLIATFALIYIQMYTNFSQALLYLYVLITNEVVITNIVYYNNIH